MSARSTPKGRRHYVKYMTRRLPFDYYLRLRRASVELDARGQDGTIQEALNKALDEGLPILEKKLNLAS